MGTLCVWRIGSLNTFPDNWKERGGEAPSRLSPLSLAFIGDAVFETMVRERVLLRGNRPVGALHEETVRYVRAEAQSAAYDAVEAVLGEREAQVLRRGRNASGGAHPKHSSVMDYRRATAVEALIGYLHLSGEAERLREIVEIICRITEGGEAQLVP